MFISQHAQFNKCSSCLLNMNKRILHENKPANLFKLAWRWELPSSPRVLRFRVWVSFLAQTHCNSKLCHFPTMRDIKYWSYVCVTGVRRICLMHQLCRFHRRVCSRSDYLRHLTCFNMQQPSLHELCRGYIKIYHKLILSQQIWHQWSKHNKNQLSGRDSEQDSDSRDRLTAMVDVSNKIN